MNTYGKLPFNIERSYSSAFVPLGVRYFDPVNGNWVAFLKNLGATTVTPGMTTVATTTDRNTGGCRASGTGIAEGNFAGVRPNNTPAQPVGGTIDSVLQNEFAAFIVNGPCKQILIDAAVDVTAAEQPMITGSVAGKARRYVGDSTNTASCIASTLQAVTIFAWSQAASAANKVDANIIRSVY